MEPNWIPGSWHSPNWGHQPNLTISRLDQGAIQANNAKISLIATKADLQMPNQHLIQLFPGHNVYLLSVAKLCKDTGQFTDVIFKCSGKDAS